MTVRNHSGGWVIVLSFIVAFLLMAMPLPDWALHWRPIWVALVLIYWCMAVPERVGVGVGWVLGLLMDVMQGTLLGQHALGMALIAFLAVQTHQRVRVFPVWQQAMLVCLMLAVYLVLLHWIRGMMGLPSQGWNHWLPALTSMLLWPWLFVILRDLRRRAHVS